MVLDFVMCEDDGLGVQMLQCSAELDDECRRRRNLERHTTEGCTAQFKRPTIVACFERVRSSCRQIADVVSIMSNGAKGGRIELEVVTAHPPTTQLSPFIID